MLSGRIWPFENETLFHCFFSRSPNELKCTMHVFFSQRDKHLLLLFLFLSPGSLAFKRYAGRHGTPVRKKEWKKERKKERREKVCCFNLFLKCVKSFTFFLLSSKQLCSFSPQGRKLEQSLPGPSRKIVFFLPRRTFYPFKRAWRKVTFSHALLYFPPLTLLYSTIFTFFHGFFLGKK